MFVALQYPKSCAVPTKRICSFLEIENDMEWSLLELPLPLPVLLLLLLLDDDGGNNFGPLNKQRICPG
jgi:hypothetical protein